MHIERVQGGDVAFLQSLVRFPRVLTSEPWWASYRRRMAAAAGLREITSAFRLCVRADGSVDRQFSAVFEVGQEQAARRFFGSFSFLEGLDEESVLLPEDGAEFERWAADFPALRCRLVPPPLRTSEDVWLACDFRAAAHLDLLVREAQSFGFGFGYQIHFRPFAPEAERQRRVGRNLIALQSARGVPADLVADQERQAKGFSTATLLVEEVIAADRPTAAEWLADALGRAFRSSPCRSRMEPPAFECVEGDCGADPALMMHSSVLYDDWTADDLYCSQAADERFRTSVLGHRPLVDPAPAARAPGAGGPPRTPEPPPTPFPSDIILPTPYEGSGPIFISYPRRDLRRIVPVLQRLTGQGLPVWYDRGIHGGEEWDVVLERKIEDASMILVFLSQATVDSKYCRREIKFADAINKPLLVVVLEAATLSHGLKFLLLQLQQISIADQEFDARLDRAIRNLLSGARVTGA